MFATKALNRAAPGSRTEVQNEPRSSVPRSIALLACIAFLSACASTSVPYELATVASDAAQPIRHASSILALRHCSSPGQQTLASVVRVASADGNDASGVVIAFNRVLTAAHVVTTAQRALVFIDDDYRDARVVATDALTDLAILEVETRQLQPIRISDKHLLQSEPVWTVGFPLALAQKANPGIYQHHVDGAIYASASTNAGASGGGLLRCEDGRFELAGMIRGYGAYWRGGQLLRIKDLSISVPADTISDFAARAGVELTIASRL